MRTVLPSRIPAGAALPPAAPVEEPLVLPSGWTPPVRPPLPILAATVPVVGALGLWLVTGSILSLWFAILGPLIALATLVDASRGARRSRKRAFAEADAARQRVTQVIADRHEVERARLWSRHPDVALMITRPEEVWRAVPGRTDALVVGSGVSGSAVRVTGGEGDPASVALRARATRLNGAPVRIDPRDGIAVLGPAVLATAVVRALTVQLCLAIPPTQLRVIGSDCSAHGWIERMPHHRARGTVTLAVLEPDDPVPAEADMVIQRALTPQSAARCAAMLTISSLDRARLDHGGDVVEIGVEALALEQAEQIAEELTSRAGALSQRDGAATRAVALADLLATATPAMTGLAAVIGMQAGRPCVIDLVADGPHAVVAGVTGSGKSELLITWVLSMCATRSTREVTFLLADFKGGTAFDALARIPHVTGVITDLDGSGARRAIESLRAEVRWREAELASSGARAIDDPRVHLPRLVIVVDEFAALLGTHPELHAVFTDVAARGRALGMHLILGTQRVAGVVRDALLTNCPLRLSLRVTDATDSRAVIGTDQASALPGDAEGRGLALVRRAADAMPHPTRIALSAPDDIERVLRSADGPHPRRPWLPALPDLTDIDHLRAHGIDSGVLLGLIDEPDQQRQRPLGIEAVARGLLVVGARGTGKSTVLATIAAQTGAALLPADPEAAWDVIAGLRVTAGGTRTVLLDDIDALAAQFPHDYGQVVLERIERAVRAAGDNGATWVITQQRPSPVTARITELLPHRAILALPSRAEHVAAGGDSVDYAMDAPPGRGRVDGRAIQFAFTPPSPRAIRAVDPPAWRPSAPVTGFVGRRSAATRAVLAEWQRGGARVVPLSEAALALTPSTDAIASPAPVVIAGDPDEWQRHWNVLAVVRGEHDLVIDAGCQSEYRIIAGERELPPYCAPGRGRAWLRRSDGPSERVILPDGSTAPVLDQP